MGNEHIQRIIEEILLSMGIVGSIEVIEEQAINGVRFHIITDHDTQLLIGNQGTHLAALSHIVRKIVEKKLGEEAKHGFVVDVDNYQGRRIAELKEQSALLADQARHFKGDVEMDPMPPYERMIVHTILAEQVDIKTESIGDGKTRRVVVRFVGGIE
ncbi:MAG: hypothetical protein A2408_03680 [Candidatus Yonathbacteria bacterium RIFOXYC1_FULL_52_10]|nr:MAG: hypothetical protein A2408_03680 [Candidatus Yonathbacteria bacterium RIFOXYC1_FULL_52_10]